MFRSQQLRILSRHFFLVGFLAWGCQSDVKIPTWDPLDYTALVDDMNHPTGLLVDDDAEATIEYIKTDLGLSISVLDAVVDDLTLLFEQIDPVIRALDESDQSDPPSDVSNDVLETKGSNLFAEVSCQGPDRDNPNKEFEFGLVGYESSSFDDDVFDADDIAVYLTGHSLITFKDCQADDLTIVGECPAYLSDENDQIGIRLNLTLTREAEGVREWDYRALFAGDAIDLLLELSDGTFYRLGVTPGINKSFRLGTIEGIYECTIGPTVINCGAIATPY